MKISFWRWTITSRPVNEKDIPEKWTISTVFRIFNKEFIFWENYELNKPTIKK